MTLQYPAITMSEYTRLIGYAECAFWGIRWIGNDPYPCRQIWSLPEREMIQNALLEAQDEIESIIHYPLSPRWFANERHDAHNPIVAQWGHILEAGVMANTMIQAGATVDYASDPAVITVNIGSCAPADVHIFLPHTDIEIEIESIGPTPSSTPITYDIEIPRCRLVDQGYRDNPELGWDYSDVSTWGTPTVDVRCIANDSSTQAVTISKGFCNTQTCADTRGTGCIYIRNNELGFIDVQLASYANGAWSRDYTCCRAKWVEINYKAGKQMLSRQEKDTIIRLAHSKMADEPCGCDVTQRLWKRDRHIPEILDTARLDCPFGLSDGAWIAWKFATTFALRRGSLLFSKPSINSGRY